jgi:hypothetical protein
MDFYTTHLTSEVGGFSSGYDLGDVATGVKKWSD